MGARADTVLLSSLIAGMGAAMFLTPVFCLLRKLFLVPVIRKRLLDKAERQGRVVQARLVSGSEKRIHHVLGYVHANDDVGIYCFEYRGRSYRYKYHSSGLKPQKLTLYFQRRPQRACLKNELGLMESDWLKYYIMIAMAAAIYYFNTGAPILKGA